MSAYPQLSKYKKSIIDIANLVHPNSSKSTATVTIDEKEYLDYVNAINECAYTDRMIEGIIILSEELKELYECNFKK